MGMRSIIRKIINWACEANQSTPVEPRKSNRNWLSSMTTANSTSNTVGYDHPSNFESSNIGLNFTIYRANGGTILQLYNYDRNTDKQTSQLYVIDDKETFGEQLELIITKSRLTN